MISRDCEEDTCIQLFRERLSEKVHATIPKGVVGGFGFTVLQRKLKELARKAMKMCLRVLTESNKSRFDSYSVSIISHITFRDCRVHTSSDNLSRNSCMVLKLVENCCQNGNVFEPSYNKHKIYNLDNHDNTIGFSETISSFSVEILKLYYSRSQTEANNKTSACLFTFYQRQIYVEFFL